MMTLKLSVNLRALVLLALVATAAAGCMFARTARKDKMDADGAVGRHLLQGSTGTPINTEADGGMTDFSAVKADLAALMTDSQDFWPADFGNYGGLFIRLSWHCSGSYRRSDGRGGCDGGRIRFAPEFEWPDNANLDQALELLRPIKEKYGSSLSWGDLVMLSGNVAIETMGGTTLGFCGGRVDDPNGDASLRLGPSSEQEAIAPCAVNGQCTSPLGPTTVGLIYVNPEGPMAVPDPAGSALDIESSFGRMGLNDSETVAFIGGGHAFGKAHGACDSPPCGDGKGNNTFTSGFEGPWTTRPTEWTNQYFQNLLDYQWEKVTGPGGHFQWTPRNGDGTPGPDIMMLTSDLAFIESDKYRPYVEEWAADIASLEAAFAAVWYKVTSADMGPHSRCVGEEVPPPQDWQGALPTMPATMPDFEAAEEAVNALIEEDPANAVKFVDLAWHCASTYRATDHKGGCNGARIRFPPESEWTTNAGASEVLALLEPVKDANPDISWADLIVLAGTEAVELSTGLDLPFCGGRVDADEATAAYSDDLAPRNYSPLTVQLEDDMLVKGLTPREYVALMGRTNPHAVVMGMLVGVTHEHFEMLRDNATYGTPLERALLALPALESVVEEYAADENLFKTELAAAWTKFMNADRYEVACPTYGDDDIGDGESPSAPSPSSAASRAYASFGVAALLALLVII